MSWKRLSHREIATRVFEAIGRNTSYFHSQVLGVPGSYLDSSILTPEVADGDPFLTAMLENPNHIGCHTLGHDSEPFFQGTHQLEVDAIRICAENLMGGEEEGQDGYITSQSAGAIAALWTYRNHFIQTRNAENSEIGVLFSEDSHPAIPTGADILGLRPIVLPTDPQSHSPGIEELETSLRIAKGHGVRFLIVVVNMGTGSFGSVDDAELLLLTIERHGLAYKAHVDATWGGFVYPQVTGDASLTFKNSRITSISLDLSLSLQAPQGSSLFLIRKGHLHAARTEEARYVSGKDHTLFGSRPGINAVAAWMLLMAQGPSGIARRARRLELLTDRLCQGLKRQDIAYFRQPGMNMVSIRGLHLRTAAAEAFGLTGTTHKTGQWWTAVIGNHANRRLIDQFVATLDQPLLQLH